MSVIILFSNLFYKHDPPHGLYHPENSKRLKIALEGLTQEGFSKNMIIIDSLRNQYYTYRSKVHYKDYVMFIEKICGRGEEVFIDGDTYVNRYTFDVATHALGCAVYASEMALNMKSTLVFTLVRPPGHHVGFSGRALGAPTQGFCIFNNIAAATMYLVEKGLRPAVIIDIDVHHGNGTQEIFWTNHDVLHVDIHEHGIYPGTGLLEDLGGGEGYGTKINIPLNPYSSDDDYIYVFRELITPFLSVIKPRSVLVSAGFDAYADDGLASMELTDKFYSYFGSFLRLISTDMGAGIVAVLEGGYSVGLKKGLASFLRGFVKPIDVEEINKNVRSSRATEYVVKKLKNLLNKVYTL